MAEPLRQPCPRAQGVEKVRTVGDLAAFSVRQEAALASCDARRAALVETIDAHNALGEMVTDAPKRSGWPWRRR